MERMRAPYQGVWNIIRFNWHFYVLAVLIFGFLLLLRTYTGYPFRKLLWGFCLIALAVTFISLLVSYYIYDLSELYTLSWLNGIIVPTGANFINVHAGFDETSTLLRDKYPDADLLVFDFYDPAKHNEVSVKRARKAYPPYNGTKTISTSHVPVPDEYADIICVILAAHEIRDETERSIFFAELVRVLKPYGKIIVTEHLRDLPNFLAYTIGFLHFMPRATWLRTFRACDLCISEEIKITPFITTFILSRNGTTA
jgi:SAM-dependent methyltransferase